MNVDFDMVLGFAKTLEGRDLYTQARQRLFRVGVIGDMLEYTPASTREARTDGRKTIEQVLARYRVTQSLKPCDYQDATFNASYLLTIVALMVGSEDRSE